MIDPKLLNESILLGKLSLCHVLLRDDGRFPWVILVPHVPDVMDFDDLTPDQRYKASDDIARVCEAMKKLQPVDKINVATIGNIVPQCHFHVVGRTIQDIYWPDPVWGKGQREPFEHTFLQNHINQWRFLLGFQDMNKEP